MGVKESMRVETYEGTFILVDPEDYDLVARYKWHDHLGGKNRSQHRMFQALVSLSVYLMRPPPGYYVDHINGNVYDFRRSNLRIVTPSQSAMNQKKKSHGPTGAPCKSRFRGVSQCMDGRWQVRIIAGGEEQYLGRFTSEVEAAHQYNIAAEKIHGEFARPNVLLVPQHAAGDGNDEKERKCAK